MPLIGGQIDMAHHDTKTRKSLEETAEFANAVNRAQQLTNVSDTLIVVTADHSHTMTIAGYRVYFITNRNYFYIFNVSLKLIATWK